MYQLVVILLIYSCWFNLGINSHIDDVFLNDRLGSVNRSQLMPNFYFFGVSKCGTSTMAEVLTEHPLITAVGSDNSVSAEAHAHIPDRQMFFPRGLKRSIDIKTNRVAAHLNSTNDSLIEDILKRGIIMDYAPHNAQDVWALRHVFHSLRYFDETEKHREDVKFLMMIRNPVTRTQSSWWFKEFVKLNGTKASFGPFVQHGIKREKLLQQCFISKGFNFSNSVKTNDGVDKMLKSKVFKGCKLSILNTDGKGERCQHIGKSLYAYTLVK